MKKPEKLNPKDTKIAGKIAQMFVDTLSEIRIGEYVVKVLLPGDEGFEAHECVMSVAVLHPYRQVSLCVGEQAIEYYKKKDFEQLKVTILHECFHVLHWKYATLAERRNTSKQELEDEEENLADVFSLLLNKVWK